MTENTTTQEQEKNKKEEEIFNDPFWMSRAKLKVSDK